MKKIVLLIASVTIAFTLSAQNSRPLIEMFRPQYLTTGFPVSGDSGRDAADVKFQVSLALPLWNDIGGKGIDVLVAYTQMSLWSMFTYSSPFYDNTYIPGLYARKNWKEEGSPYGSTLLFGTEHRSNGRNDAYSRSVNYLVAIYGRDYPSGLSLQAALRAGYGWYGDKVTMDLPLQYFGLVQLGATYTTPSGGWEFMGSVTPLWNKSIANVNAEVAVRLGKRLQNPYFFIQFHYGYDEALRDCMDSAGPIVNATGHVPYPKTSPLPPRSMLRFGFLLTPHDFMRGNI